MEKEMEEEHAAINDKRNEKEEMIAKMKVFVMLFSYE